MLVADIDEALAFGNFPAGRRPAVIEALTPLADRPGPPAQGRIND